MRGLSGEALLRRFSSSPDRTQATRHELDMRPAVLEPAPPSLHWSKVGCGAVRDRFMYSINSALQETASLISDSSSSGGRPQIGRGHPLSLKRLYGV